MPVNDYILLRKGSSSEWSSANPVLASGEPGFDITNNILKIGDGVTTWPNLDPIGSGFISSHTEINVLSQEPQGFVNRIDSSISFNDSTRTFTIQPTGSSYDVYIEGIKVTKTGIETVVIDSGTALNYIHFDTDTYQLQTKTSFFNFDTDVPIAFIHWNSGIGQSTFFGEERHGIRMDSVTHKWIHNTFGMQYIDGLSIGNYVLLGDGSSNSHAQISVSDGTLYQEDIIINITDGDNNVEFTQQLSPTGYFPVYYHSGITGQWVRDSGTPYPVKYNATRALYNSYSGGTWSVINVPNNRYFAMWLVATNDINDPILSIMGQREDSSLGSAENNNNWTDIDLTNIPTNELRPLYRLIFLTNNTFTNTPKSSLQSILDLRKSIITTTYGVPQNDHGVLFGLGDDDHAQYVHINEARTISANHTFTNGLTINNGLLSATSGNFTSLTVNNTGVSLSGHTHSSSNITNFNSSVSGLVNGIYAPLTGTLNQFANTTSSQLSSVISDETGSGLLVFNNSPTFTGIPLAPTATSGTNTNQIASTSFVRTEISNLVNSAPSTLDTLNELAAALGNDANFSTTITNTLADKANLSGSTFTGSISAPSGNFTQSLQVNGTGVSLSGHSHTNSDITNWNEAVDDRVNDLLVGISGINISYNDNSNTINIAYTGSSGGGGGGGGVVINNYSDNRLLTSDGSSTGIDAESGLIFLSNGNKLGIGTTDPYGNLGLSNGYFNSTGDSQKSSLTVRNNTSNNSSTTLYTDGISEKLVLPISGIWNFNINLACFSSTNEGAAGWNFRGCIKRNSSTTSLVGSLIEENFIDSSLNGVSATVVANTGTYSLDINVNGLNSNNILWTAGVDLVQTLFRGSAAASTPTPTPSVTATPTITSTQTSTPTVTPTNSATQTITPTTTPTTTPTITPTVTTTTTNTPTVTNTTTQTPTPTVTPTTTPPYMGGQKYNFIP